MVEPCELSAVQARKLIGERSLSPVALLESCIERIEAVNPAVNAIVTKAYDQARSDARDAEAAVAKGGQLGLLHGLPVVIKDTNDVHLHNTFPSIIIRFLGAGLRHSIACTSPWLLATFRIPTWRVTCLMPVPLASAKNPLLHVAELRPR